MTINLPDDGESAYVCMTREEYIEEKKRQFNFGGLSMFIVIAIVLALLGAFG